MVSVGGVSMINELSWAVASQLPVLQITWKFPLRHLPAGFLSHGLHILEYSETCKFFNFILSMIKCDSFSGWYRIPFICQGKMIKTWSWPWPVWVRELALLVWFTSLASIDWFWSRTVCRNYNTDWLFGYGLNYSLKDQKLAGLSLTSVGNHNGCTLLR